MPGKSSQEQFQDKVQVKKNELIQNKSRRRRSSSRSASRRKRRTPSPTNLTKDKESLHVLIKEEKSKERPSTVLNGLGLLPEEEAEGGTSLTKQQIHPIEAKGTAPQI